VIRAKAKALRQFQPDDESDSEVGDLSIWLSALPAVLDHFVATVEGYLNLAFWGSVCNLRGASMIIGSPITGWIGVLFPYLNREPNRKLGLWDEWIRFAEMQGIEKALTLVSQNRGVDPDGWVRTGIDIGDFPMGIAEAPLHLTWVDVRKEKDLKFYGGLFTMHQHRDGAFQVRTAWAVPFRARRGNTDE
jgi:hypothetical protein